MKQRLCPLVAHRGLQTRIGFATTGLVYLLCSTAWAQLGGRLTDATKTYMRTAA